MALAALDAVLLEHEAGRARETVPVLAMLSIPEERLRERAAAFARSLEKEGFGYTASVTPGSSAVGGGAAPTREVPTALVAVTHAVLTPDALSIRLRAGDPPVLARIVDERLVLDLRTVPQEDEGALLQAFLRVGAEASLAPV
jgi:L-seryl-tRNA(Ser) seleniumtransferase